MTSAENAAITSISVNPTNPDDFLVGYGGGSDHLYRYTLDVVSFFLTYTYVPVVGSGTSSLPSVSLNAIARDIDDPVNTWYVATDVGVFQTTNAGTSWTNTSFAYGLPDVIVEDLVAVPGTRTLNAATYGRGLWSLYLEPNGANLNDFTLSPVSVVGGNSSTGTVTLNNPAGSGGMVINLTSNSAVSCPSSVTVPAGQTSANFTINTQPVASTMVATVIATQHSIGLQARLQVVAPTLQPPDLGTTAVLGGTKLGCRVSLTGVTTTGVKVNLTSSSSDVVVSPSSVTIPAGSSSADFNLTTIPVSANVNATITATPANGGQAQSSPLEVEPASLTGVSISPLLVVGSSQTAVTGTLTFDGATPSGGVVVKLFSTNTTVAIVPASLTVKLTNGATTATFPITTKKVSSGQTVTIQAEFPSGNWQTAEIAVLPFILTNIAANPSTVNGGSDSDGTVQVNGAPSSTSGSVIIKLTSSASVATVPASVAIPVGKTTQTFNVGTKPVSSNTSATITGTLNGSTQTATVNVQSPTVVSLIILPTSVTNVNTRVACTVTLSGNTPAGGTVVTLTSSTIDASVPKTVTVAAGRHTASFRITHREVLSTVTATIAASIGSSTAKATLTLKR